MNKIKLNFETLTPLHISNGNQLAYNIDYILMRNESNSLAKLNLNKASKKIAQSQLFDFNKNYRFFEIIKIIEANKKILNQEDFEYCLYVEDAFIEFVNGEKRDGQKIVQEFINSNGNFYIPASSVKGMLTTILSRDIDKNPLGINPKSPNALDKFVIHDSEFISSDNFRIDRVQRPPAINLITLDPGVEFRINIFSKGNLDIHELRKALANYSISQLKKAKPLLEYFKALEKKPGGASAYLNIINTMLNIEMGKNEYLLNLGFGGGSYFKIYPHIKPYKFTNPGRKKNKEEAHTTFYSIIDEDHYQLGWCKLTIEEE